MSKPNNNARPPRPVVTNYFLLGRLVKSTRSSYVESACNNCFAHMQVNEYGATLAQVMDADTEELYAEFFRKVTGQIKTNYLCDLTEHLTPKTAQRLASRAQADDHE